MRWRKQRLRPCWISDSGWRIEGDDVGYLGWDPAGNTVVVLGYSLAGTKRLCEEAAAGRDAKDGES